MISQDDVKAAYDLISELERLDDTLFMMDGLSNGVSASVHSSVRTVSLCDIIDIKEVVRRGLYDKRAELTCRLAELGVQTK